MKEMKKILKKSIKNLKLSGNFIQNKNLYLQNKPLFSKNLIKNKISFFKFCYDKISNWEI